MVLITAFLGMSLSGAPTVDVQSVTQPEPAQAQTPAEPPAQDPKDQKAEAKEPPTPAHTGIHALFGNLIETSNICRPCRTFISPPLAAASRRRRIPPIR